jgi:hypothetical protein
VVLVLEKRGGVDVEWLCVGGGGKVKKTMLWYDGFAMRQELISFLCEEEESHKYVNRLIREGRTSLNSNDTRGCLIYENTRTENLDCCASPQCKCYPAAYSRMLVTPIHALSGTGNGHISQRTIHVAIVCMAACGEGWRSGDSLRGF